MAYQIALKKKAVKSLENISEPYYSNIKSAIISLEDNPRPHGYLKLKNRDGYRIRIGDYRVIYDIFDHLLLIDVVEIGHRREIYD